MVKFNGFLMVFDGCLMVLNGFLVLYVPWGVPSLTITLNIPPLSASTLVKMTGHIHF